MRMSSSTGLGAGGGAVAAAATGVDEGVAANGRMLVGTDGWADGRVVEQPPAATAAALSSVKKAAPGNDPGGAPRRTDGIRVRNSLAVVSRPVALAGQGRMGNRRAL